LASKIQTAVPADAPGQPRKYLEEPEDELDDQENPSIEMINNSDDENVMQDVIKSSPTQSVTPQNKNSEWRVLRSISANSAHQQPVLLTKTTTTTTTRTVSTTLSSSSPGASPTTSHGSLRMTKSRSARPRVSLGSGMSNQGSRVHSGGIRKTSGKKI